jgi:hypothetical protein
MFFLTFRNFLKMLLKQVHYPKENNLSVEENVTNVLKYLGLLLLVRGSSDSALFPSTAFVTRSLCFFPVLPGLEKDSQFSDAMCAFLHIFCRFPFTNIPSF